jgi:hypothetical protein
LTSTVAWGAQLELDAPVDVAGRAVELTVTSELGSMFDSVDFDGLDDEAITVAVLRAVAAGTIASVSDSQVASAA